MQKGRSLSRGSLVSSEQGSVKTCNYYKKPCHLVKDCRQLKWKIQQGLSRPYKPSMEANVTQSKPEDVMIVEDTHVV